MMLSQWFLLIALLFDVAVVAYILHDLYIKDWSKDDRH